MSLAYTTAAELACLAAALKVQTGFRQDPERAPTMRPCLDEWQELLQLPGLIARVADPYEPGERHASRLPIWAHSLAAGRLILYCGHAAEPFLLKAGQELLSTHPELAGLYTATLDWLDQRLPLFNPARRYVYAKLALFHGRLTLNGLTPAADFLAACARHPHLVTYTPNPADPAAQLCQPCWANLLRLAGELEVWLAPRLAALPAYSRPVACPRCAADPERNLA